MADRRELFNDPDELDQMSHEAYLAEVWTSIPGIIQSVDLEKQTCTVQPAVMGNQPDEAGVFRPVKLPLLLDVPICFPRAGGFALTFPVAPGDECLVNFSSRCIDNWWKDGGIQEAAEWRMHDLSDGFAILAPTSQPKKLSDVSTTNVQLRNESGDTFLEIDPNGMVRIITPGQCIVDAQEMYFTASASMKFTSPTIWMAGNLMTTGAGGGDSAGSIQMKGQIELDGDFHSTGDVVAGNISLDNHTHQNNGSGVPQ